MGYLFVLTVFELCERGKLLIIISFLPTINHQSVIITRDSFQGLKRVTLIRLLCSMLVNFLFCKYIQSNPVNTETDGATESIRINGVSVLSGSCYENQKDTFCWYKILRK